MVESKRVNAALQSVKPLCVQLVTSPSSADLHVITTHLKTFDQDVMQQLQQFLIFPLRTVLMKCLSKSLPEQVLIETCHAMDMLLCKSRLRNIAIFMDLFSLLSDLLLSDNSVTKAARDFSEEEKTAAIQTLCSLLNSCQTQVLHGLYLPTNIARLGSIVSQIVGVVSNTRSSRSLCGQAMTALLVLLQKRTYKHKEHWQHGNRFASLLPGISTAMLKVLLGDSKQGHQLFCKALEVWTEVVCLTVNDESLSLEQKEGHNWIDELQMEGRLKELIGHRDDSWVKTVVPKVEFMIKEISKLKKHHHWKVRCQLVSWADCLLTQCNRSLQTCRSQLLEVLVLLMTDSYPQVATPATAALERFRTPQDGMDRSRQLIEILKEDLFALLTSLPRRIRMEDEEEKQAVVGLLVSYISQIGCEMSMLLLSQSHVTRLIRVLVQVLEMDVADQKILEESGMGAHVSTNLTKFVQEASVMKPRKVFLHFRDDKIRSDLFRVCHLLGKYGDVRVLVESVMEMYRESSAHSLSCVLIINEILTGVSQKGEAPEEGTAICESSLEEVVRLVLEEYLSYDNMNLCDMKSPPTRSLTASSSLSSSLSLYVMEDSHDSDKPVVASRNRAIMLTCLLLEGVAVCAQVLVAQHLELREELDTVIQKVLGERFRLLLIEVLYPVAEKVGSEISAVSGTAYLTLSHMAQACGYRSVDELIQSNSDYMVTSISLRLWHFEQHPRAPSVLSVMLQLCSTDILPLVWDSVLQILDTLDEHHAEQAATFLPVLHHLTMAVARWFPPQKKTSAYPAKRPRTKPKPEELVQFLLDRRKLRLEAENFSADPEPENAENIQEYVAKLAEEKKLKGEEEEEGKEDEEKEKEPPLHVKAVKEVLQRAKHIVSSSNPRLTLLALDVIAEGCADLADYENELLPIVHQLWPSFKQRFQDAEKLVVIKAVKTLLRLCECCGDFIRQRVEKDVLSSLKTFLRKQAHTSQGSGGSYVYTVNYKLQLSLLTSLGDMAHKMELDSMALETVLRCCLPYLSQQQPHKLQKACVESVKRMMECNRDVVWLALCGLYTPSLPSPPSSNFKPVTIFKDVGKTNEYTSNVTQLLEHLNTLL